jgi:hypothetical protein
VGGIVVAHAGFGAADERGVAEDEPGFLGPGEKRFPEGLKGGGRGFDITGECSGSGPASEKESQKGAGQKKGEHHDGQQPSAGSLLVDGMRVFWRKMGVPVRFRCAIFLVEREGLSTFGEFDAEGIGCAFARIVFQKLRAQATRLDTDHGVDRGIEVRGPAELLCRNLVFLYRYAGMLNRVLSEIAQELA